MTQQTISTALMPQLQCRSTGEPTEIRGYAAVFYDGTPATEFPIGKRAVERVCSGAFDDLAADGDVVALFNHDRNRLLGRISNGTLRLSVDSRGLAYSIPIDLQDADHCAVVAKLNRGDLRGSSFSFLTKSRRVRLEGSRSVLELQRVRVVDVGPVTQPAYLGSTAEARGLPDPILQRLRLLQLDQELIT